ncbi:MULTISPECIES: M13 family metallopeptidase [Gammaproteobacteria]|uniref:M13 family metallopeptidase n=1 Tax=Gammaproteobacteria TaxID=1236 RepID=UPI000DD0702A|nr:M13 family metallopeptidase [Aliidiomarina sp. B3213]RTE86294.1 M13 family peptidase [Aliidiomarina sp. B3213]TCZ91645.1 M13 family peptidase [Lysobacter sp. N42]
MLKVKLAAASIALALGLAACVSTDDNDTTASTDLTSGLMLEDFDTSVRPQDDLFMFVNGSWYENTEIPSDRSRFGSFDMLARQNETRLRSIIEDAADKSAAEGTNEQKIGDFYNSFMDEERIEALGLSPIQPMLAQIGGINSHEELTTTMASMRRDGLGGPLAFYVSTDAKNPEVYALHLVQSGLGLPDRDYYFRDNAEFENIRTKYVEYLEAMFAELGHENAADAAQRVYDLELSLAEHHWTRLEIRDAEARYNKMSIDEVRALTGDINYDAMAEAAGVTAADYVIVNTPSYIETLGEMYTDVDLATWKDYLQVRLLSSFASRLHSTVADLQFDFYSTTLNGTPEQQERWKRGVQATNGALGEVLGQEYVARHFPPEAKERMGELIDNLLVAMEQSINELEWMTPDTKVEALEKLANFTPKIGYPDEWRDFSDLEIMPGDLIGNTIRAANFEYDENIADIGQPVDRSRWGMNPQRVNAYYSPTANEIVFPAGILQPPFFDMNADDAVNYGGIGAVIGHEIGHGFDDQGSRYDGQGNLRNWWSDQDREQFEALTGMLVEQYSAFEPLPGMHIDGRISLGENIGDHVGLLSAYRAYQMSLDGEASPVMDGFTGEQRFFLSWAQIWKGKYREDAMRAQLARGPHSPAQYRALGAPRNIPAFYEAFNVQEGDGMYLAPEDRVIIW